MFDLAKRDYSTLDSFIAKNASVFGDVEIGRKSSILFHAVVRGDTSTIRIGDRTNVQDLCCIHADPGFPCEIGSDVTIGHRAVVHGAKVADHVLIGIGAIVLNGAMIGEWSVIAAGALVPEGKVIPPRSLVMGVPGKVVREVTDVDIQMIQHAAEHYVELSRAYLQHGTY